VHAHVCACAHIHSKISVVHNNNRFVPAMNACHIQFRYIKQQIRYLENMCIPFENTLPFVFTTKTVCSFISGSWVTLNNSNINRHKYKLSNYPGT
jgi:hypothetical protein